MGLELDNIYNMDCLEGMKLIPDGSIDCIVTSPPYNKGEKYGGDILKAVVYDKYMDKMEESEYQANQIAILNEMSRILKKGGSIFYNHKNRYIEGLFISPLEWILKSNLCLRQEIVWDRTIANNIRGWRFWNVDERIYWLQRKDAEFLELDTVYAQRGSVWKIRPESNKGEIGHPCPFPITIPDLCISSTCKAGDTILDPYMGSGTVAVSAVKQGCHYIGFDVSEVYCKIAKERVDREKANLRLF